MKVNPIVKKTGIRILKIVAWITFSVAFLLVAIALLIQVPSIQNKVVQKAVSFLRKKIKTEVRLDQINISFPKKIVLTGLYIEDQQRDTLIYAGELGVDTDLWALLNNEIQLDEIDLTDVTANVSRSSKSNSFNFSYIVDAFANDAIKATADTIASPWTFAVGNIQILNTSLSYKYSLTGIIAEAKKGEAEVEMNEFDLENTIYKAGDISFKDVRAAVLLKQSESSSNSSQDTSASAIPTLGFDRITLTEIKAVYTNQTSGQVARLAIGGAEVEANEIKLQEQMIDLERIQFFNSFISYQQMKTPGQLRSQNTEQRGVASPWGLKLGDLDLTGLSLQYYNFAEPVINKGIDFNHLWISKLNLKASNLALEGSEIEGEIEEFSLFEKSGLSVNSFQSQFAIKNNSLQVNGLSLQTPGSRINLDAKAEFNSLLTISNDYPEASVELVLKSSSLAVRDLLYFQPNLMDSIPLKIKKPFSVDADIIAKGKVNDMKIDRFNVRLLDSTRLSLTGSIKGLPDFTHLLTDIKLKEFHTTKINIRALLADSLIPASINIPNWLTLNGDFKGTPDQPYINALLQSSSGSLSVDAKMNLNSKIKENYKGELIVSELNVGEILGDTTLGKLDMKASLAGSGLKLNELDAAFEVKVNHFEYNDYDYKNFNLKGSMQKYFFSGSAFYEDKNLDFHIKRRSGL